MKREAEQKKRSGEQKTPETERVINIKNRMASWAMHHFEDLM